MIAFVFNMPLPFFEKKCLAFWQNTRLKRAVCILLSAALLFACTACLCFLFVPKLLSGFRILWNRIPLLLHAIREYAAEAGFTADSEITLRLAENIPAALSKLSTLFIDATMVAGDIFGHFSDWGFGFVFAFYLLSCKEKICAEAERFLTFFLSRQAALFMKIVLRKWYVHSRQFFIGQCKEAVLFGSLSCIVLHVFRIPYANFLGMLLTVSAIVPMIGPMVGGILCTLLILTVSPMKALTFLLLYFVMQQAEDNLIYPKVVGNSVGLPNFGIFCAVLLGHKIGGIFGILLLVPTFATLYDISRDAECCALLAHFRKKIPKSENNT